MIIKIFTLIKKDIRLEFRNKAALAGLLLYVVATVFVCYQAFVSVQNIAVWNALLWIILLFGATNASSGLFTGESGRQRLFYYTLASPQTVFLAKIGYSALLIGMLSLISSLIYILVMGYLSTQLLSFLGVILAGSIGLSSILTLVSGIASKTSANVGLIAILAFPLMIPLLLVCIKLTKNILDQIAWSQNYKYLIALIALDVIIVLLGFLLFPFVWKD